MYFIGVISAEGQNGDFAIERERLAAHPLRPSVALE
jgi:hypothetical protein